MASRSNGIRLIIMTSSWIPWIVLPNAINLPERSDRKTLSIAAARFGGKFHPRATLIKHIKDIFSKTAEPAVHVVQR